MRQLLFCYFFIWFPVSKLSEPESLDYWLAKIPPNALKLVQTPVQHTINLQ